jgi:hypothetical protein
MSPKGRDLSLAAIPEDSEAKPSNFNDEDAEDREEQGLFEQDNADAVVGVDDQEELDGGSAAATAADATNKQSNLWGEDNDISNGNENGESGRFYIQSSAGDSWELTWPIWHMLPRNERRAIATQHGMKSIGEFEEYMSLSRAVDDSEGYSNNLRQAEVKVGEELSSEAPGPVWQPPLIFKSEEVDDNDDDLSVYSDEDISPSFNEGEPSILMSPKLILMIPQK